MDFAKALLEKYGWKEGEGLGANKTGISKAIKPGLKKNRMGLGADPTEEFTNAWWQKQYNKGAQSIEINQKESEGAVKVSLKKIKKKKVKKEKEKTARLYNNFVKTAILDGDKETEAPAGEKEEAKDEAEQVIAEVHLTDEQLLAACGGRTAHKAARHGHKLSGKLARLKEADEQFKAMSRTSK